MQFTPYKWNGKGNEPQPIELSKCDFVQCVSEKSLRKRDLESIVGHFQFNGGYTSFELKSGAISYKFYREPKSTVHDVEFDL